jgi:hypothetical protein
MRPDTESPSRRRKQGIPRFRSGPLPKMNHFHLNLAQSFVTTTEPLRKKWQLIFPIHHLGSLFARDHLLLNKMSYPPYAIAETVIVSNYDTKRQHPRSSPVRTHPRRRTQSRTARSPVCHLNANSTHQRLNPIHIHHRRRRNHRSRPRPRRIQSWAKPLSTVSQDSPSVPSLPTPRPTRPPFSSSFWPHSATWSALDPTAWSMPPATA